MSIKIKTSIPGPKSQNLMQLRKEHVPRGPFHSTPLFIERAHGAVITDVDGNQFLDFASGIGVTNLGHTHPDIVDAVCNQARNFFHSSFNVLPYENYVRLAEKLNERTPGKFAKKTFLANSGAEAVENAIKIARAFTGRRGVVCFEHAFHGRTYMAMSLTYKEKPYKADFGALTEDLHRVPFPYVYRGQGSKQCFETFLASVSALNEKPAAVIIEPVLGEGGFIPAPKEFLMGLQKYCNAEGIVFIADEIQTGFGRTGTLFALEQFDVVPDLILSAKGLANGLPLSAVTGRSEIMDAPCEGGIGGTFGGNPLACAAALAVLKVFESGKISERATKLTKMITSKFESWAEKSSYVGDIRGLGPMQAIELVKDKKTKEPFPDAAKKWVRCCYEHGVIIMTAGSFSNVVRLLIPLVITESELSEGLGVMEAGLESL